MRLRNTIALGVALHLLALAGIAAADGCFFVFIPVKQVAGGTSKAIVQTRQEAIMYIHPAKVPCSQPASQPSGLQGQTLCDNPPAVTYLLRSRYMGSAEQFAWVIPVPATPTDVVAQPDNSLFDQLDQITRPTFKIYRLAPERGLGCACGGMLPAASGTGADTEAEEENALVTVEASGQAGAFGWAALTSRGSEGLLDWLNTNGYAVPGEAGPVLDRYIQQDMHFLALRITQPEQVTSPDGEIEIPPIQFTCQTSRRVYPMAISQISSGDEAELLLYVIGEYGAQASNIANATISGDDLRYRPLSPTKTNYEEVFRKAISDNGGQALITEALEYLDPSTIPWMAQFEPAMYYSSYYYQGPYSQGYVYEPYYRPTYLTRLRTVLARESMDFDLELADRAVNYPIHPVYWIERITVLEADLGGSLGGLLLAGAGFAVIRKWARRKVEAGRQPG